MQSKKRCADCHHFRVQRKSEDWLEANHQGSPLWRRKIEYGYALIYWCQRGRLPREFYVETDGNLHKIKQEDCLGYYVDKKEGG